MKEEDTIESKMRSMIREWGRGRIFFLDDFAPLEDPVSVRQFICGMVDEGFVIRLARGIYCYPRLSDGEYSSRMIIPDAETIAYALAAKENVRITPYGDLAAYKLGLTSMVVSVHKYLTDGSPRIINLSSSRKIYFNHTSEVKMFAYCNETMQMLSSSIRALGKEYLLDPEKKRKMRDILRGVPESDFAKDITLPPAWVGEILTELWNS